MKQEGGNVGKCEYQQNKVAEIEAKLQTFYISSIKKSLLHKTRFIYLIKDTCAMRWQSQVILLWGEIWNPNY